jgi:hypothetical protein
VSANRPHRRDERAALHRVPGLDSARRAAHALDVALTGLDVGVPPRVAVTNSTRRWPRCAGPSANRETYAALPEVSSRSEISRPPTASSAAGGRPAGRSSSGSLASTVNSIERSAAGSGSPSRPARSPASVRSSGESPAVPASIELPRPSPHRMSAESSTWRTEALRGRRQGQGQGQGRGHPHALPRPQADVRRSGVAPSRHCCG